MKIYNDEEIKYMKKLIDTYKNFIIDVMDFNGYTRDFIANKLNELEERAKEEVISNGKNYNE